MNKILMLLRKNKKGFTLLECVVSIAIIGIICSSILSLFSQGIVYIKKAKVLDAQASSAEKSVLTGKTASVGLDDQGNLPGYVDTLPVQIQFTINYGSSNKRQLASLSYQFSAGVNTNTGAQTRVVYFDMSAEELTQLK